MRKPSLILVIATAGLLWFGLGEAVPQPIGGTAVTQPTEGSSQGPAVTSEARPQLVERATLEERPSKLFRRLEEQFNEGSLGPYRIVSSDAKKAELKVRRDSIDNDNWTKWCYCKVDPLNMLDSLQDGTVLVTIDLSPVSNATDVAVATDFEGTYSLTEASKATTVSCMSRGVLEKELVSTIIARNGAGTKHLAGSDSTKGR
jgi:hypothetical protein